MPANLFVWTEKVGGRFMCCPWGWKVCGRVPPRPLQIDAYDYGKWIPEATLQSIRGREPLNVS